MKKTINYIMIGWKILVGPWQWNYKFLILICLVYGSIFSCKNQKQSVPSITSVPSVILVDQNAKPLSSEFLEFYKKFHSDSVFQMEHIDFPLSGLPDRADPEDVKDNDFFYTADQWVIHKPFDPKKFSISYFNLGDVVIEERIQEKEHNLKIIRRFAKNSSGWRLIYYAGLNKYK